MSTSDLTRRLAELLDRERGALAEFLLTLADFDRRRCWIELGHSSLFYFLHRDLGLSKGAAYHRKVAAELLQRYPEIIEPLRDGRLCITSVVELSKVITPENREAVVPRFFHCSKREAMAISAEIAPRAAPHRVMITALSSVSPLRCVVSGDAAGAVAAVGAPSAGTTSTAARTSDARTSDACTSDACTSDAARATAGANGADARPADETANTGHGAVATPAPYVVSAGLESDTSGRAQRVGALAGLAFHLDKPAREDARTDAGVDRVQAAAAGKTTPGATSIADTVVPLTADLRRLHVTVSRRFLEKLGQARDALSHTRPGGTVEEVLESALDLLLRRHVKRKGVVDKPRTTTKASSRPDHIPAAVKRKVWLRDRGCCQWPVKSGGVCGSTVRVEFDHVIPRARNGPSTAENIRLLCKVHNQVAARRAFGDELMDHFVGQHRRAKRSNAPGVGNGSNAPTREPPAHERDPVAVAVPEIRGALLRSGRSRGAPRAQPP